MSFKIEVGKRYVMRNGSVTVHAASSGVQWCYLGPIPEILPPKKKVVQRLWIDYCEPNDGKVLCAWFVEGETIQPPGRWIRTDETREVTE